MTSLTLSDTFRKIRPCIVAFASRLVVTSKGVMPLLPQIIGTGFFVDERGIVATNDHVIDALKVLPRIPGEPPTAFAMVFTEIEVTPDRFRLWSLNVEIRSYKRLTHVERPAGHKYWGQEKPDIGFVILNVRDVPVLPLANAEDVLKTGLPVATAGFPAGETVLQPYGAVNQLTPFLRQGIVSSVLPYDCPQPHGFTVDIMMQPGASGSPIFLQDKPLAVGIVHATYPGTNFTLCNPSQMIFDFLKGVKTDPLDMEGVPTLTEQVEGARREWEERKSKQPYESELLSDILQKQDQG
jgi:hypothetical protein